MNRMKDCANVVKEVFDKEKTSKRLQKYQKELNKLVVLKKQTVAEKTSRRLQKYQEKFNRAIGYGSLCGKLS